MPAGESDLCCQIFTAPVCVSPTEDYVLVLHCDETKSVCIVCQLLLSVHGKTYTDVITVPLN